MSRRNKSKTGKMMDFLDYLETGSPHLRRDEYFDYHTGRVRRFKMHH